MTDTNHPFFAYHLDAYSCVERGKKQLELFDAGNPERRDIRSLVPPSLFMRKEIAIKTTWIAALSVAVLLVGCALNLNDPPREGWTMAQVRAHWGAPTRINSYGLAETWIYLKLISVPPTYSYGVPDYGYDFYCLDYAKIGNKHYCVDYGRRARSHYEHQEVSVGFYDGKVIGVSY